MPSRWENNNVVRRYNMVSEREMEKQKQDIKPEREGGNKTLLNSNNQDPKKDKEKTESCPLVKDPGKNLEIFKRLISK